MMGTINKDVASGIANGTCSTFERAVFKPGKSATPIQMYGKWVYCIDIEDVDHLILRWQDSKYRGTFRVKPETAKFTAQFPVWDEWGTVRRLNQSLSITHFPLLVNYATTGHKLQGKSLDQLVIAQWSKQENWAYVVLSRVRTLEGLFLTDPIPYDIEFVPSPAYQSMMESMRTKLAKPEDVAELYLECGITSN